MHAAETQNQNDASDNGLLVLVIEDDSLDFTILERQLRGIDMFKLVWAPSMSEGLAELAKHHYDIILLDLSLPDSMGLPSVEALAARTHTPVVVVSGLDDESTALKAVQCGAQDYLVKGQFSTALICKTLRYTVERHRLLQELNHSRELIQRERELRRLESDAALLSPAASKESQVRTPLINSHPAVHEYAVAEYSRVLDSTVENRLYKTAFSASSPLRELAIALGNYEATPRDIVEIHTLSMDTQNTGISADKRQLRNEEARYLLTGLLGHLCAFYLSQCQLPPPPLHNPGMDPAMVKQSTACKAK